MTVSAPCVHSMLRFEPGHHGAGSGGTWDKRLKFVFRARNPDGVSYWGVGGGRKLFCYSVVGVQCSKVGKLEFVTWM